jgi:hypothetical protein
MKGKKILDTHAWIHREPLALWDAIAAEEAKRAHHQLFPSRFERIIQQSIQGQLSANSAAGDMIVAKLYRLFYRGMGVVWQNHQSQIFEAFVDACMPKIYGDQWPMVQQRVMTQRNIHPRLYQEVLIVTNRRLGKTYSVSGIAACMLLVVPNFSVAVFSVRARQAKAVIATTLQHIRSAFENGTVVRESEYSKIQQNQERITFHHVNSARGEMQTMTSYPGMSKVRHLFLSPLLAAAR